METLIRLGCASGIFVLMIAWEALSPRRVLTTSRQQRWLTNLSLAALNMLIMRFSVGSVAYLTALLATELKIGLLPQFTSPLWLKVLITLLVLDFAIYLQHILAHRWQWLWRLHQVHHTDLEMDATTAVRFHPLEILLSLAYKLLWILLIGAIPLAVIGFEILLNAAATFNHSNVYITPTWEKIIRYALVTPDMHRIHHSVIPTETNSNYGFFLSCWDKLCGTYTAAPQSSYSKMLIGLENFRKPRGLNVYRLLILPFQKLKKS